MKTLRNLLTAAMFVLAAILLSQTQLTATSQCDTYQDQCENIFMGSWVETYKGPCTSAGWKFYQCVVGGYYGPPSPCCFEEECGSLPEECGGCGPSGC